MSQWSDGALANAVMLSQVNAYTELWRRHLDPVRAVVRMVLGKRSICEDVAAAVFVGFWLAPENFDPRRGTVLSHLRLMARRRSIDVVSSETSCQCRASTASLAVPLRHAEAGLLDHEVSGDLRAALVQLPRDERNPIELAFFLGMTYGAVARRLQLPESTVKERIRRGLHRLELSGALGQGEAERSEARTGSGGTRVAAEAPVGGGR